MMNHKYIFSVLILSVVADAVVIDGTRGLARHELFWEYIDVWPSIQEYAHSYNQLTSKMSRDYIIGKGYRSVLDAACGPAIEWLGYEAEERDIIYQGIDITPRFVNYARSLGARVMLASIESIPFDDGQFEVVFARYILEHLRYYKKAISEMIRVAEYEVVIVLSHVPGADQDVVEYALQEKSALFNNCYNKQRLEDFVMSNPRVERIIWERVPQAFPANDECIMHIHLKK